jgi:hypothetical protein
MQDAQPESIPPELQLSRCPASRCNAAGAIPDEDRPPGEVTGVERPRAWTVMENSSIPESTCSSSMIHGRAVQLRSWKTT